MSKRQPRKAGLPAPTPNTDPAHAPGKHHLAREHGAAGLHAVDRRQQRMAGGAPSTHNRRSERGR